MNKVILGILLTAAVYVVLQKTYPLSLRPEKIQSDPVKKSFLNSITIYAADVFKKYGISPIIFLSQASLESNWGASGLARQGKNLFGIKVSAAWEKAGKPVWVGETEELIDGKFVKIKDRFKQYASWDESIIDWAELISQKYKTAYSYAKGSDVAAYGQAIVQTGYSTHPRYASLLSGVAADVKKMLG